MHWPYTVTTGGANYVYWAPLKYTNCAVYVSLNTNANSDPNPNPNPK